MKKINFLLLGVVCLFTSCSGTQTSDSSSVNSNLSSNSENSIVSESESLSETSSSSSSSSVVEDDEYNTLPNWLEINDGVSLEEDLLDILVDRAFVTGLTYNAKYSLQPADYTNCRIISSNSKVFSIEKGEGNAFQIHALHAGQAYLRIYDSLGDVRYCKKVVIKDQIPLDEMEEHLVYECEYWKSVFYHNDHYILTFNEGGQYTLSGIDPMSNSAFSNTGTYEYVELSKDGREYCFKFTDKDIANYSLVGFNIAINGSFMYLMARSWTETIMLPSATQE